VEIAVGMQSGDLKKLQENLQFSLEILIYKYLFAVYRDKYTSLHFFRERLNTNLKAFQFIFLCPSFLLKYCQKLVKMAKH